MEEEIEMQPVPEHLALQYGNDWNNIPTALWPRIKQGAQNIGSGVKNAAQGFWEGGAQNIGQAVGQVAQGLANKIPEIMDAQERQRQQTVSNNEFRQKQLLGSQEASRQSKQAQEVQQLQNDAQSGREAARIAQQTGTAAQIQAQQALEASVGGAAAAMAGMQAGVGAAASALPGAQQQQLARSDQLRAEAENIRRGVHNVREGLAEGQTAQREHLENKERILPEEKERRDYLERWLDYFMKMYPLDEEKAERMTKDKAQKEGVEVPEDMFEDASEEAIKATEGKNATAEDKA